MLILHTAISVQNNSYSRTKRVIAGQIITPLDFQYKIFHQQEGFYYRQQTIICKHFSSWHTIRIVFSFRFVIPLLYINSRSTADLKPRAKMPVRCSFPYSILAAATDLWHREFLSSTAQMPWTISTDGLKNHTKYLDLTTNAPFSVNWTRHLFRSSGKWPGIIWYVASSHFQNVSASLLLFSVR